MVKMDYDVIIIGSGPAGLTCGITLHNAGIKVLILEKDKKVGSKICAGMIDEVTEEVVTGILGELPDGLFSQPNMYVSPQVYYEGKLIINSKVKEKNLDRKKFDEWMVSLYKGDILFGGEYKGYSKDDNGKITVNYSENSGDRELCTKVLVDASGYNSEVIKTVYPKAFEGVKRIFVEQIIFKDKGKLDEDKLYLFLKKDSFMNYLVPKNGLWHLCVGDSEEEKIETVADDYIGYLREEFDCCNEIVEKQTRYATDIWINPLYGKENIAAVGEAAGLWGKCGDGIRFGVHSGYLCALSILEVEEGNYLKLSEKYIEKCDATNMTEKIVVGHGNANALNRFHRKVDVQAGTAGIYRRA